jgi:uncharacterized membrane protein
MRVLGHPVHTMLLHFPVALWPAHWALHLFAMRLPPGIGAVAFWLLAAGTGIGWVAALCGAADLLGIWREGDAARLTTGIIHGSVNGCVLAGFTCLVAEEYSRYPAIAHGAPFLVAEGALLAAMFAGNYFGGTLVWRRS